MDKTPKYFSRTNPLNKEKKQTKAAQDYPTVNGKGRKNPLPLMLLPPHDDENVLQMVNRKGQKMETVTFKYKNGIEVRDRVTGLKGIINARCEWLNGCLRYSVQPKADEKEPNKMPEGWWIDEAQLEVISDGLNKNPVEVKRTGGQPMKSPRF